MNTKYLPVVMLLAFAVGVAGCAGQQGADANMNANGTERYGMRLHTAGDRNNLTGIRDDDFLIIGNSVFIVQNRGDGTRQRISNEEIQQNFRGMRFYRVAVPEGIQAMDRIKRSLNDVNDMNTSAIAQDLKILLESAKGKQNK